MKSSKAERDTAPFPGDSFPFLPVPKHALPQLRNRSGGFLQGFVKCQPPESHSSPQCLEFEETLFSGLLGGLLDLRHPGCLVLALVASLATSLRPVLPRPCGWELGALLWICTDSSGTSPTWLTFTFPPRPLTRFLSSLSLLCFPHPSLGCLLFPSERKKKYSRRMFFPSPGSKMPGHTHHSLLSKPGIRRGSENNSSEGNALRRGPYRRAKVSPLPLAWTLHRPQPHPHCVLVTSPSLAGTSPVLPSNLSHVPASQPCPSFPPHPVGPRVLDPFPAGK